MRFRSVLALLALSAPALLAAQSPMSGDGGVSSGLIYKRYSFGSTYPTRNVAQIAVPLGVVIPVGRQFSVDIGTYYASTTTHDSAGNTSHKLDGFTDTQVRGSYVFGNDRLVLSLMLNLPTGKEKQDEEERAVASSIASNFLLFPVASYGNGFSGTLGAAVAVPAGGWNLGLSASGRLSAKYHPYSDSGASNFEYKPGFEGRIRVGADHLIGASRLSLGFTLSTFSNDQSSDVGGAAATGSYTPSTRYISQVSLTSPIGTSTLAIYAWDYYRAASKSDSGSGAAKENIFTAGAQLGIPAGPKVTIQPLVETRLLGAASSNGSGLLFGVGATARVEVAPRFSLIPGARYDTGHIKSDAVGKPSINGFEGSLRFRYTI